MKKLTFIVLIAVGLLPDLPRAQATPPRIGQIFIVGNTITRQSVILDAVELYPGQVLCLPELDDAERRLTRLGIFAIDDTKGIRPRVSVLDPEVEGAVKDILVEVQETRTSSAWVEMGFAAGRGPVLRLVFEERNFDPLHWPAHMDDFWTGRALRGGGHAVRLHFEVPIGARVPAWRLRFD
jgi:outer membrane protein assembly factor BamA